MKTKLAVLTTHPIQYQAPLWRALAQRPEIDLHVYFGSNFSVRGFFDKGFGTFFSWDVPLTDGYSHTFLSTDPKVNGPSELPINFSFLNKILSRNCPDYMLINGYSPFLFYLVNFILFKFKGIPVLIRTEATDEAVKRSWIKHYLRHFILKLFYTQIHKFCTVGHNSRIHYLTKGVPLAKLFFSPYNSDSVLIGNQVIQYAPYRYQIRKELGFTIEEFLFLFSGKLIPKKEPLTIARAFRYLAGNARAKVGFVVMGDGELRQNLESEMRLVPEVKAVFLGFQNQSAIGRYYAAADCLILPSSFGETWGLVVNEALQFGMLAIVSDRVGCRHDLIVEGETGFVFPVGNAQALADLMLRAMELMAAKREIVKEACRRKAQDYSLDHAVAGILEALS